MDLERTTCLDFRGQMAIKSIGNGPPSKEEIIIMELAIQFHFKNHLSYKLVSKVLYQIK